MAKPFREIIVEYAQTRGGGLPLTPEEMCNAVALWVQQYVKEESGIDVYKLAELIVGSETVVVDINETNDKLEIHLDGEVLSKIERAVLVPIATQTEAKVPVLGVDRSIEWAPVSDFVSGGLYRHKVTITKDPSSFGVGPPSVLKVDIYSSKSTALTFDEIQNIIEGCPVLFTTSGLSIVPETARIGMCLSAVSYTNSIELVISYGTTTGQSETVYGEYIYDTITQV